jgi:ATP-dependent Clp protease ATP-binding subunit ClpC
VIMTSNLGAENFRKLTSPMGFLSKTVGLGQVEGEVMRELERRFPPEFRNRIDEVVLFAPLTHDEVREIAKHYLQQMSVTMAKAGKTVEISDEALELVVEKGYNMAFGARFLKRFIDEHVKLPISTSWKGGSHFSVVAREGEIVVESGITTVAQAKDALAFGDVA